MHDDLVRLTFDGGTTENTADHPFFVKGKGWSSAKAGLTKDRYSAFRNLEVHQLQENDICLELVEGVLRESALKSIEPLEGKKVKTYNFRVKEHHSYFANGITLHDKN